MDVESVSLELSKRKKLAEIEEIIHKSLASGRTLMRRIGAGLIAIKEGELWQLSKEDMRDFYGYCFDAFGMEHRSVKYAMDAERTFRALENAKLQLPAFESQAAELARLPDDERKVDVWRRVLEMCAEQNLGITVLRIREAVSQEKEDLQRETLQQSKEPKKDEDKPPPTPAAAPAAPAGVYVDMGEEELLLSERGEEALARIQAICGAAVAQAIRSKANEKLTEESLCKWADQEEDTVEALAYYVIDKSWTVRKALGYLAQMVDGETKVDELVIMARNRQGRLSCIHQDARITVEITFYPT
jgi:hypothetical protein